MKDNDIILVVLVDVSDESYDQGVDAVGGKPRRNHQAYSEGWDRIFGKKNSSSDHNIN